MEKRIVLHIDLISKAIFHPFAVAVLHLGRMNDQPQPEKIKGCLEASLKKDMKAWEVMIRLKHLGKSSTDQLGLPQLAQEYLDQTRIKKGSKKNHGI